MMERGSIRFELTSADIPAALESLSRAGVTVRDVAVTGDITVSFETDESAGKLVRTLTEKRGELLRCVRVSAASKKRSLLRRHVLLLAGILLLLSLTVFLPTRVLFIRVEGNSGVSDRLILEQAENCGIRFWASRSEVRSERMKNALLDAIPELQWAGVNTSGCVATISVRERKAEPERQEQVTGSIIAVRDAVIRSVTVSRGTGLCVPGQAVRSGDILISGYTDCGISILATRAEGEVLGETSYEITAVTPPERQERCGEIRKETKFSLLIGKKRINFYEDSGILDATCVKMYEEHYLTLPGGFQLPLVLVREEWVWYDCGTAEVPAEDTGAILTAFTRDYLLRHMTAGQLLQQQEHLDGSMLYGNYICLEMIGQIRFGEITEEYGQDYGENS